MVVEWLAVFLEQEGMLARISTVARLSGRRHCLEPFLCIGALSCWSVLGGDHPGVENFELLDRAGVSHELYYLTHANVVVLMSVSNTCDDYMDVVDEFDTLRDRYRADGVEFLMIDPGAAVREPNIDKSSASPILIDDTEMVSSSLGFTHTGEVLVIGTKSWRLLWRGDLRGLPPVVEATLSGSPIPSVETSAFGCRLRFSANGPGSYSQVIAPILIDKCVPCHRDGGIGSWVMSNYEMVLGFSPMMREVIRTARMPPWGADPAFGSFSNDRSLTVDEKRDILRWIEAGSPPSDGPDPLKYVDSQGGEWDLGEPDAVVEIPDFDIPASGMVYYRYFDAENPFKRDVWLKAVVLNPGDRQALHHVLTLFIDAWSSDEGHGAFGGTRWLDVYTPGTVPRSLPETTGALLPTGASITLQMHYTPYGKAATDKSRLGLYLHKVPPKRELSSTVLMNKRIRIPPLKRAHTESDSHVFDDDVLIYALLPHAHYRGSSASFVAHYPDGSREVLLSVPSYDFNWQTTYQLLEPRHLVAGTRVVHTMTWDNSSQNPANFDPNREVRWGLQSWDEMLFGVITWAYP